MRIDRVTLYNFRQYFGEHILTFPQSENRNVTVIHGANGAGKTSLFLALNWALYGEGVDNIGQIISKEAVSRAKVSEVISTKIDIRFSHEGKRYTASRELKGQKKPNGTIDEVPQHTEFLLLVTKASGIAERVDNPIGLMNTILPSNVRTYFFFDGEKIDNFARPEAAQEVREAILKVLSLDILTRAKTHLSNHARDLQQQLKSLVNDELKGLIAEDEQLHQEQENLHQQQANLNENIASARRRIDEINQKLRDFDAAQALQRDYDRFTQQLQRYENEFADLTKRIRDIASQGYIPTSMEAVSFALELLEEKRKRGEIPSNIRQQFIEDLLQQQVCICGRPFSEHDNAYQHLVTLLNRSISTSLEDDVLTTTGYLRSLRTKSEELQANLRDAMQQKVKIDELIDSLYAQRDDIERQMKNSDLAEISNLAAKRDEYSQDIERSQMDLMRCNARLDQIKERLKILEKQIENAQKTEYKAQLLSTKVTLARNAAEEIERLHDQFAEDKRKEVEAETRRIFHSLAWKSGHFQEVRLTPEYQLEVIDRYGLQARPELSAGERQVLSLSFIAAMAEVAQSEAPLVMDTPFGRLSSAHREAITKNLPDLTPQLIIFVTDEELRDQALENLQPRIGAQYRLHFDPETSCTEIKDLTN